MNKEASASATTKSGKRDPVANTALGREPCIACRKRGGAKYERDG